MKASVFFGPKRKLEVRTLAIDSPMANEVLVDVAASGLCHSDYHHMTGDIPHPAPAVLGHEVAGLVAAVGESVTGFKVGDHVVSCPSLFCGKCLQCVTGNTHRCESRPGRAAEAKSRLSLDGEAVHQFYALGGFAEQILVHENSLVTVSREMPLDRAAIIGCGVLTGVGAVFNSAKVHPGSKVVVIGCGGVGLSIVQAARIAGAGQIIAIDRVAEKLEIARKFGATDAFQGGDDAVAQVRELSHGGADYVFEAIGIKHLIEQGVQMLAPGGLMVMVGATRMDESVSIPVLWTLAMEWRIQGVRMGSSPFTRDIPTYASLYLQGKLDLDTMIAERIGLEDIDRGYATMLEGKHTRSVVVFDDVMKHAAAQ